MSDLAERTRFEPSEAEPRIVERWLESGLFHPEPEGDAAENYSIAIPPPNVTGVLHMGHALNGSIQDVLIRYNRMRGRRTKWILGTDHAGIATQRQVEQAVIAEGSTREDLGRDAFIDRVWQWREQYGSTIIEQFQRLGASCDYQDERFTLDPEYVEAVLKVFVDLYEKGYIYRDRYLVNWDPGLGSAISDLEVENREAVDTLYSIAYPLADGGEVVVATVRPETMLADTAVAVHPEDDRYRELVGREAILPLVGRRLPIIADDYVKPEFGTGALKITPGHDPNDFDIGRRHGLDEVSVIGEDGRMTDSAGERFAGLSVDEARAAVVAALEEEGLIRGSEPYTHEVPFSQRSGVRIEPLISLQWFMRMDELAAPAIEAVKAGRVRFHPERFARVYLDWMENIRPWCISRQLWWGHQLPVWYRGDETYVGTTPPEGEGWDARPRRARHLVLVGAVAVRDAGLAAGDAGARRVLSHRRARHGARHHLPLGRADDHDRPRVPRPGALLGRLHHVGDPGARRQADVEVARQRDRPARRDRQATARTRCASGCSRCRRRRTSATRPTRWPRARPSRTSSSTLPASSSPGSLRASSRRRGPRRSRTAGSCLGFRRSRSRPPRTSRGSSSTWRRSASTTSSTRSCATTTSSS